eukprot:g677.t1
MPVKSLPEDKAKIAFHAAMMAIQNFGFFIMYAFLWNHAAAGGATCASTAYATGMMTLTCFGVAFLCVGMGMGGYTDDKVAFTLLWFLHLVGGSFYTACTVIVPAARWSDEGKACAANSKGIPVSAVYIMHAALYLVYVGGMLSITYFSFLKQLWTPKIKLPQANVLVAVVLVFGIPQAIVYATTL